MPKKKQGARIVRLKTKNVKRIKAVELKLKGDGGLVVVSGNNEEGKSSLIDSIAYALGGKKLCPAVPLRRGQKQGYTHVTLDNGLTIERTYNKAGSSIKVLDKNDQMLSSPQRILDKLYNSLTFDPLEWMRLKSEKQVAILKQLAGIDTTDLDNQYEKAYADRRDANRDLKRATAAFEALPKPEASPGDDPINTDEVSEKIDELLTQVSTLRDELEAASQHNQKIEQAKQYWNEKDKIIDLEDKAEELDELVKKIVEDKSKLIAKAKYPVDGLGFNDDGVTMKNLPFNQASQAEQLRVSVAMGLATNPDLRVMLIRDGSLLDAKSKKLMSELAKANDAQIWLEVVGDEDKEVAVIIEDGRIKEQ